MCKVKESWEEKALAEIEDSGELCDYCPWKKEGHHPSSLCEGCSCEEAREQYLDTVWAARGNK